MNAEPPTFDPNDPNTWPIVECESADIFHDSAIRDCTPDLTDEQKTWPIVECESADVFIDTDQQPAPPKSPREPGR